MGKLEATNLARIKYGPTAFALRVSQSDRNQRFGILFVDDGAVLALGFGSSYESAFAMADKDIEEIRRQNVAKDEVKEEVKENNVYKDKHD